MFCNSICINADAKKGELLFQLNSQSSIHLNTYLNNYKSWFLDLEILHTAILLHSPPPTQITFCFLEISTFYVIGSKNILYQKVGRFYKNGEDCRNISCLLKIHLNTMSHLWGPKVKSFPKLPTVTKELFP